MAAIPIITKSKIVSLYFNLIDGGSKLTIYYNDSLSYDLLFSAAAARVNHFEMQDDLDLNNILAVQSMAGLEVHLEFNNLQYLKKYYYVGNLEI